MSTHMPVFQSYIKGLLHHFVLAKSATSSIRVIEVRYLNSIDECNSCIGNGREGTLANRSAV